MKEWGEKHMVRGFMDTKRDLMSVLHMDLWIECVICTLLWSLAVSERNKEIAKLIYEDGILRNVIYQRVGSHPRLVKKHKAKQDKALFIIVLAIEPSPLYLSGERDSPVTVWIKLADQFQKKMWANKLALHWKLYSQQLKNYWLCAGPCDLNDWSLQWAFSHTCHNGWGGKRITCPSMYDTLVTALEHWKKMKLFQARKYWWNVVAWRT